MSPRTKVAILVKLVALAMLLFIAFAAEGSATVLPSDQVNIAFIRSDFTCCDTYQRDIETYVRETLPNEWYLDHGNNTPIDQAAWRAGAVMIRSGVWWRLNRSKLALPQGNVNWNCYQGTYNNFFYYELAPNAYTGPNGNPIGAFYQGHQGVEQWLPGHTNQLTDQAVQATTLIHAELVPPPASRPDPYIMLQYGNFQPLTFHSSDWPDDFYYALGLSTGQQVDFGTCSQHDDHIVDTQIDLRGGLEGPSALAQLRGDGTTPIPIGGFTADQNPVFAAQVSDPDGLQVRLEIELRRLAEYGGGFTGVPTHMSDLVNSGSVAKINSVAGLISDSYHWQARVSNSQFIAGRWVSPTGITSDVDLYVGLTCQAAGTRGGQLGVAGAGGIGTSSSSCGSNTGSIGVKATLNGADWSGPVNYTLNGPTNSSEASLGTFSGFQPGTYTLSNVSGGPAGASFTGVAPPSGQLLNANGSITFTLNYTSQVSQAGTVTVNATLDGNSWSGPVTFQVSGPGGFTGGSLGTFSEPTGFYAVSYVSGGPAGASILGTNPPGAQSLTAGGSITFTLVFQSSGTQPGFLIANATMDGVVWQGSVIFQVAGPGNPQTGASFPFEILASPGTYTLTYITGGPPGAQLANISPAPTQTVGSHSTITFTFNFITPIPGFIAVNGTLDGAVWSGSVAFQISGIPGSVNGANVPNTFAEPPGPWSVQYVLGGPANAVFLGVVPVASAQITAGVTIPFTLAFASTTDAPQVVTGSADSLTQTGAGLHLQVNPNGTDGTNVWFEYGLDTSYGSSSPAQPVLNSSTFFGVSQPVSGLLCQTTYHYRAVAANSAATAYGNDANFTTAPCGQPPGASFYTILPPCRFIDTRKATDPNGPALNPGDYRTPNFVSGPCGIPSGATAVSINITVVDHSSTGGFLTLFPQIGVPAPNTSTINFGAGQVRANNAVLPLNGLGSMTVYCAIASGTVDYIVDVNGYFQ